MKEIGMMFKNEKGKRNRKATNDKKKKRREEIKMTGRNEKMYKEVRKL